MYYLTLNDFIEQSGRFKGLQLGQAVEASLEDFNENKDDFVYDEKTQDYLPWVTYCYENVCDSLNSFGEYCSQQYQKGYIFLVNIGSNGQWPICEVRLIIPTRTRDVDPKLN